MPRARLLSLTGLFLKLGTISFGGPAAHISLMEEELVRKRKWMTHEHFLDLIGATNLIPGPNSTEMAMHCGHERAGKAGLVVAGLGFILPATLITALIAWAYQQYGQLPDVARFIMGIKPAVIAVIAGAAYRLGVKAVKNPTLAALGIISLAAVIIGFNEIICLFAAGILGLLLYLAREYGRRHLNSILPVAIVAAGGNLSIAGIFLTFLKVGALLYGSGYVLFGFLDAELVEKGYMARELLIDAVAVGQFTPGPVLSAATFIGWQLSGWQGALAATAGIFLPSFLFVWFLNPVIPRIRKYKAAGVFLDSVNVASVAIIAAVGFSMARESVTDWKMALIALLGSITTLVFKRIGTFWIIAGGAILGYLLFYL